MAKAGLREASMELTLRFAHMWWAGFKVSCRWCAFYIVLGVLCLPATGLGYLVWDYAGQGLAVALIILIAPIPFYLTSKHLHLLESGGKGYGLGAKILISMAVACVSGMVLTPSPDPLAGLVLGYAGAFLCGVSLLILSRFRFMKSASKSTHTLICVLVCVVSLLFAACLLFVPPRIHRHARVSPDTSVVSPSQ
jgi:hypothetical protein